ncbi:MAG TPA: PilZ domain-containing protein [Terriglobales bacterium]|nr:PilZ domain-containing protein [Terriglobales bacterium]
MSNEKKARGAAVGGGTRWADKAGADKVGAGKVAAGKASAAKAAAAKAAEDKFATKRRFPRFTLDARLQVKMFQDGEFRTCWGRSTEIGQDGIGATLTGNLATGEIVTLEIPLPLTPYPIKVRAIVRFCQGLRYGFEFLTMNESQRDTVRRVCQYLATRQ